MIKKFFDRIVMFGFGLIKTLKETFYGEKKPIKIWDVNANSIVASKLI